MNKYRAKLIELFNNSEELDNKIKQDFDRFNLK